MVASISPKASERHPELINTGEFSTTRVTDGNQGVAATALAYAVRCICMSLPCRYYGYAELPVDVLAVEMPSSEPWCYRARFTVLCRAVRLSAVLCCAAALC